MSVGFRAVLNDSYRTQLGLLHSPYMMAIACMHVANVVLGRSIQKWLESLTCDMDEVCQRFIAQTLLCHARLSKISCWVLGLS